MKLIVVTCLKEDQQKAGKLLLQAGVQVYSASPATGYKNEQETNLLNAWFSAGSEAYDSVFMYSFTTAESAQKALALVKAYNLENDTDFPLRAFILPVEQHSY